MFYRILTKNGIENTNIDGARDHNFNAGRRSGIVKGALNQGNFFVSSSNTIVLDTCELRLCGHRVVIDKAKSISFHNQPSVPIRYSLVARIIVDNDGGVSFDLHAQTSSTALVQDNLDTNGSGTYELEIGRFTQLTDGTLTDVVRTADLITGGGNNDSEYIRIGTVTTNKISPELDADVDIENTINPDDNKPQTNFTFNLPTSVGTVVSVNGEEKTSINTDITPIASSENLITSGGVHDYPAVTFAESERQKSKNLFNKDAVLKNREINGNTGEIVASTNYWVSDYIRVAGMSYVYISSTKTSGSSNVFYDNNYNILSISSKTNGVLSIASNAVYMRCNGLLSELENDIQIEKGTVGTSYQPYNGKTIREKQLTEAVEKRELIYSYLNVIPITDSTLTTLSQYFDLFNKDENRVYYCLLGALQESNFKNLVGTPEGFENYADCFIKHINKGNPDNKFYKTYELMCYKNYSNDVARAYIYKNLNNEIVVTGWKL